MELHSAFTVLTVIEVLEYRVLLGTGYWRCKLSVNVTRETTGSIGYWNCKLI